MVTFLFQYVFFGLGLFCLFGIIFSFIILFRLLRMFRSIKFINKMFAVLFLVNSIASLVTFRWLFEIGFRNFPAENMHSSSKPSDGLVRACRSFIIALFAGQVTLVAGNSGILFCRFIYVRHATGLVEGGEGLFHRLVTVLVTCFTLQFNFIFPISGLIKYYDTYPLNMLKASISQEKNSLAYSFNAELRSI